MLINKIVNNIDVKVEDLVPTFSLNISSAVSISAAWAAPSWGMTPALELLIRTCDTNFGNMEEASRANKCCKILQFINQCWLDCIWNCLHIFYEHLCHVNNLLVGGRWKEENAQNIKYLERCKKKYFWKMYVDVSPKLFSVCAVVVAASVCIAAALRRRNCCGGAEGCEICS